MTGLTYLSVCSGIEAATVAWHSLGWRPVGFSEIEAFPSAVLAHHYPSVRNFGDMTKLARMVLAGEIEAPDVLVGGTPCQAFSVAGLRAGLADPRGALTLAFQRLANAIDHVRCRAGRGPCTIVWENVPGVLSSRDNAFGCFLGALVGEDTELQPAGKRWTDAGAVFGPERAAAWRVLDAQYFGLAQRRRRVFVVASAGAIDPCAVLFELDRVRRDSAPCREAREGAAAGTVRSTGGGSDVDHARAQHLVAGTIRASHHDVSADASAAGTLVPEAFGGGNTSGSIQVAATLTAKGNRQDFEVETFVTMPTADVVGTLTSAGGHAVPGNTVQVAVAHQLVPVALHSNAQADQLPGPERDTSVSDALTCSQVAAAAIGMRVRRLTPRECERLQGFPDDYTAIPWRGKPASECPDGPRYKALGNSMAVPVMHWIGQRIHEIHPGTREEAQPHVP